jgi:hypothetical protein
MVQQNFYKIKTDAREKDEMEVLKNELSEVKKKEKAWEAERGAMKEDKKKLK